VEDLIAGVVCAAAEAEAAADAAASDDDSLCCSDNDDDDDDDMDEPTAFGVMKSLGVPLDTPDADVDVLARAKIDEAAIGVDVLAAIAESAGSGLHPATDFIYGYTKLIGSYAQGGGDVETFPSVFCALLSQAKLEFQQGNQRQSGLLSGRRATTAPKQSSPRSGAAGRCAANSTFSRQSLR